jgi:hypothetical protein
VTFPIEAGSVLTGPDGVLLAAVLAATPGVHADTATQAIAAIAASEPLMNEVWRRRRLIWFS